MGSEGAKDDKAAEILRKFMGLSLQMAGPSTSRNEAMIFYYNYTFIYITFLIFEPNLVVLIEHHRPHDLLARQERRLKIDPPRLL
jgi:hypothetical protein